MAALAEATPVSFEDLAELEKDFDDVETDIIEQQTLLQAPLFEKRQALVSKVPNFWPLVLEQAPPDIDQYIQPSDSAILANHLTNIDVTRFEIPPCVPSKTGSPRSIAIRFGFSHNDWFEDTALEKKFWYRHTSDGWAGLVSEPVKIHWKKDKDLTQGLTDAAVAAWKAEKSHPASAEANGGDEGKTKRKTLPEHEVIIKEMENSTEGSLSFFSWFGFRGRHVSATEAELATKAEAERRAKIRSGEKPAAKEDGDDDDDEEEDNLDFETEIFPAGEDLAMAISEDLYPGALKYFTLAQEDEGMSDADFEEDDDDEEEEINIRDLVKGGRTAEDSTDDRPKKKVKA